jgi:flagellar hook-basal body complex protein FliE
MVANFANAISAYANAGRMTAPPSAGAEPTGGASFGEMLKQAAGDTVDALRHGEAASLQAAAGKADLAQVTAAVTNAEVVLQAVVAVRDRVVQAYQDISRLSI